MADGQFELPGMPEPLYPCTPTRLAGWRDCPRRYRFGYLDRPAPGRGAPWAHTSVGAALHSVLADWFGLPAATRTPDDGARLVRRRWLRDGFADERQSVRARQVATGWVRDLLGRVGPEAGSAGVERTVATRTATLALSGRADRIDLRGVRESGSSSAELVIVDYKTGRSEPTPDDARASLALGAYALAAADLLRRPCRRVELHHLPSGTVAAAELTAADLAERVAELESLGAGARTADAAFAAGRRGDNAFPPVPGPGCSWCDYRRHCPEGRAAAPDVQPWAGLHPALTAPGLIEPGLIAPGLIEPG